MSELSDRLARAAGDTPRHLDVDDLRQRADRHRRQHRTVRGVGVVAVALVVVTTAVFAVSTRSSTTEVAHPDRTPAVIGEPGRWVPIAEAPIRPRRNAMTVWTGSEVLVFGGFSRSESTQSVCPYLWSGSARPCPEGATPPALPRGAAAYDPATDSWSRIAPIPDGYALVATNTLTKTRSAAVVDGKVYAVGWPSPTPTSSTRRQLLSYDPGTDDWSVLGPIDPNPKSMWQLTSFGDELVAFPQAARPESQSAHIYDPNRDKWREVPLPTDQPDLGGAFYATPLQMTGAGSALYLFYSAHRSIPAAGESGDDGPRDAEQTSGLAARVAVFDGHGWQQFTARDSSSAQGRWLQTGDRFTMFDVAAPMVASSNEGSTSFGDLIFDPSTNTFDERPSRPTNRHVDALDHAETVTADDSVARVHSTLLEVLAPTQDHWLTFDGPSKEILDSFATTWVGDQLFFWGGHYPKRSGADAVISDMGWIWTPPIADGTSSSPSSPTTVPVGASVSQLAEGTWRDLPAPPVTLGGDAGVVWTGTRLFGWGGTSKLTTSGSRDVSDKGALYDPATRNWRTTSTAPIAPRSKPTTVWTGTKVLVWGGLDESGHVVNDGAAYDPATDTWRKLPSGDAPGTGTRRPGVRPKKQAAAWTGTRLAVFTPIDPTSTEAAPIAQSFYDPTTDTWQDRGPQHGVHGGDRLAGIDAVSLPNGPTLVWLSWSSTMKQRSDGSSTENLPAEQSLYEVDTSPDAGIGWTDVSLPASAPVITDPIVAGDVVAATSNPYWLAPEYLGPVPSGIPTVVLSLTEGRSGPAATWTAMPQGNLETASQPQVWTGDAILRFAWSGGPLDAATNRSGDLAALDPTSEAWTDLPRSPWAADPETLRLVWAGDRLIVWGQLSTTCVDRSNDCTPFQGRRILGTELDPD